jgi:peptide/nickel transport system substrate-binding protein
MKHFGFLSLVAASLFLTAVTPGSTRPHYGGTLRVETRDAPASLDPADSSQPDSLTARSLSRLMFDTLVILDERGWAQPALATSWQAQPGNQRWQFTIRRGVSFHDGSAVNPDAVAASLRTANPNWKVIATGDGIVIECEAPTPNLPSILALTHYGIAKRAGGKLTGSGPFAMSGWDPGKKLALTARDDYWGGRAFVDAIDIEMGKSFREQMMALDLGKADVAEVAPDQARRAAAEGRHIESSAPAEWMGLVFSHDLGPDDAQSGYEKKLRQALTLSIDRTSLNTVLLQGAGEPASTFLPDWMTGYAFLFPTGVDMQRAQLTRGEVPQAPVWTIGFAASGYDASNALGRVIAERIALNARDAGLRLQTVNSAAADLRLVRIPLASLDARVALSNLATKLGLPQPKFEGDPSAGLFAAENTLLQARRVIPLLHLRTATALSANVKGWTEDRDGSWQLQNVWLGTGKP